MTDDVATIIEAMREWQEATFVYSATMYAAPSERTPAYRRERKATAALKALRLPPVEEARRD